MKRHCKCHRKPVPPFLLDVEEHEVDSVMSLMNKKQMRPLEILQYLITALTF